MEDEFLEPDSIVDLRALEYVSTYDGHLMCPICHCPFIRPIRLKCDHIFCQKCLNSCITSSPSHIPLSPPSDNFACPSCRTPTMATFMKVPRIIISMCDDLCVKCPFAGQGCEEIIQRGHVQAHVDKYCDYRLMRCPEPKCNYMTRKKDLDPDRRCLHELRTCDDCEESVMERDFEVHKKELCSSLKTECTDCHTIVRRSELPKHLETCLEVERTCCAAKFGCPEKFKIEELTQHEQACTLAKLGPYLEAQASRMESMESTIKQLRQRNEILEDCVASIRSTLAQVSPLQASPQSEVSPIIRSDSPVSLSLEHLNISSPNASNNPTTEPTSDVTPPFQESVTSPPPSNTTTYLLSIHESLREDVTQLSNAISDIDARVNMSVMNESIRLRDEMAHISAGVNAIRMQVHWLMNPRLHQNQRTVNASATTTSSTSDTSRNMGGVATVAGQSGNPSSPPAPIQRGRRLSDGSREGTKL
ncbi:TRAF-type zinc finger protein [Blastomyces dermatitidis ER-3]|uniref:TRAF-type zinc finger protein n=1 Tax=Ajellomyces dermatitidis (strain ER-3 / ATCC MYA-2586) TaxID=559297 RepID=A0ABM9YIG1_AJEDR|nr:TRAF-type zinc finger protein [Blastomyces dermatitidis ER-3]EEQ91031.2 TRAF-type zinc finger protein [Blastomyces dermatitidis ER-3]